MSKILVSGGAGFIGSNLVDRLIADGHQVAIIDNLSSGKREYINPLAKFFELDIRSPKLKSIFDDFEPDYVFHLAAQIDVRVSVEEPQVDTEINVLGGLNILEASRLSGVTKVIFASTGGAIYGETDNIPTPESSPTYPLSPYGINKLSFEKYLNYYYQTYKLNYSILRFANVYGPRQFKGGEAGVIAIFIDNAVRDLESKQFGDGLQTRDFVYVDDVVEALVLSLDIDCRGEINISWGAESNLVEIQEIISEVLGREIKIKIEEAKLGEQRRSSLSRERAKAVLNWEPQVNLREGIRRTIAWTKEQLDK